MRCPVCDTKEPKWKNLDHFRLKKEGMSLCETCGFISYPNRYKTEDEIKQYYKDDYRPAPQASNLFTGERKLQYHSHNLGPLFEEWKKAGITKPVVGEIGSAMGMFLNWVRQHWPDADLHGTELTETFKRVAYWEYGLRLENDFDTTKKYDLIASYHVLEHQLDPDIKLKEYADCLKDTGVFYLSCPIWFRDAHNGATGGFDVEYYYHPDHVNSWSETHLEWVIERAGLEVVWKNDDVYGNTYILKKTTKSVGNSPKWNPKENEKIVERIWKCYNYIQTNETGKAIETYPNCITAWVNHYELNRQEFDKKPEELQNFIKEMVVACPNTADSLIFAADIAGRYDRFQESRQLLEKALKKKPNNPSILVGIANNWRMEGLKSDNLDHRHECLQKSVNCLRFVMRTSTESLSQALSWVYQDESRVPIPDETKESQRIITV